MRKKSQIAVIDFETDPFLYGRVPKPFCVEFYTDTITEVFWGDDCAEQLNRFLVSLSTPYLIYAHNGGKFDFHFLHEYIDNPCLIIKSRIVECKLFHHTLRDSYAILPVPLRDFDKGEIDYSKMESAVREKHKDEILVYLHRDCVSLYNAVTAFIERFGRQMTIGGTAIKELKKLHPFRNQGSTNDATFRPFYYGGRVQCFKGGIIKGPWKLYDVNSMYPFVMKEYNHPINGSYEILSCLPDDLDKPFFVKFLGTNRNALPSRNEDGSLVFIEEHGIFYSCSHEFLKALEHNLITVEHIFEVYVATEYCKFDAFVDKFTEEKTTAKKNKDVLNYTFAKLLQNSGYGRAGINPYNFEDWVLHRDFGKEEELYKQGYTQQADYEILELWSKPAEVKENQFCDVAIAASITSAARAVLLEGLQYAVDPVYCDTDSIICRDFNGNIDPYILGSWDLEKNSEYVAIAGKKLYCLFNENETVKLSSKGGTLSREEIIKICQGEEVNFINPVPSFSLHKPPSFISRRFRSTVDFDAQEVQDANQLDHVDVA